MSMESYPCSGYVVPMGKIMEVLKTRMGEKALKELERNLAEDSYSLETFEVAVQNHIPGCENFSSEEDMLMLALEDFSDDIDRGKWYVRWYREELYTLTPNPIANELAALNIHPTEAAWTKFC